MIEVRGLTKRYGSTVAVDRLSFDVPPGAVTGFLGLNGSGKSTTMRMILGLDAPDAGHACIGGQAYRQLRWPLREAGGLLESRAFHPGRSAHAHLAALAASNSISQSRVAEVLEIVGLGSVARKRAGKFSLGMAQRLGIAAALLGDPAVLLLDEPVNGLDPEGIRWIRCLLRSLAAEGRAVLVSSHLISEMALMADRLVVIGKGRLLADTTAAELSSRAPASKRPSCNSPAIVPSTRQGTCHDRPHQPPAIRQIPIPAAGPDGMDQAAQPALHLAHLAKSVLVLTQFEHKMIS